MKLFRKKAFNWSLFVSWVMLITYLSLIPSDGINPVFHFFKEFDKVVHFIFYFGFAFLIFRLLLFTQKYTLSLITVISAVIAIVYSGLIEITQEYLIAGRSAEFLDFFVNMLGAILAVVFSRYFIRNVCYPKITSEI